MFQSRFGGNVTPIYLRGAQGVGISNVVFDRDTGKIETTLTNGTVKTQDFEFGDAEAVNFGTVEEPVNEVYIQENRIPLEPMPDAPEEDLEINEELLLSLLEPYVVPEGSAYQLRFADNMINALFTALRDSYDPEVPKSINPNDISFAKQHQVYEGVYKYDLDINQVVALLAKCVKTLYDRAEPPIHESKLFQVMVGPDLFSTYDPEVEPYDEYCIGASNIEHPLYTSNNIYPRKMNQYAFRLPYAISFLENEVAFTADFFSTNEIAREGGHSITVTLKTASFSTPYDYTELFTQTIDYLEDGHKEYSTYALETVSVPINSFLVFTLTPFTPVPETVCSWEGMLTIHLSYVRGTYAEEGYDVEL